MEESSLWLDRGDAKDLERFLDADACPTNKTLVTNRDEANASLKIWIR